jgi:hypothetical protein
MEDSVAPKVLGIVAIVLGAVGFVFCPVVIAAAGLLCGIIGLVMARNPGDRKLCIVGVVVATIGLVGGVLLGLLVVSRLGSEQDISPFMYSL